MDRGERGADGGGALALLIVCAASPGCATPVAIAAGPAEPALSAQESAPESVRFALELSDPETPLVGIHVAAPGDADGESELTLAEGWAGIAESGRDLELVEASGAAGPLAAERVNSFTWRVRHAPGEVLALVFELRPTDHRKSSGPPEYYLPILERRLLHALGAQTLPSPTHLDQARERPIALEWIGFDEAGWSTISSHGTADVVTTRSLDEFRHALFLAGDLRLSERDVHGKPVWIAAHGEWSFPDAAFADLAARIVALGREFFAEFEQPFYLVSLIPVGTDARTSSFGGTGLSDSFALFLTRDVTLAARDG